MNRISDIETKLAAADKEQNDLLTLRDNEGTEFTDVQKARFHALTAEIKSLSSDLEIEKEADAKRKRAALANSSKPKEEEVIAKQYSMVRAVQGAANHRIDGLEAEMSKEAENELRASGVNTGIQGVGLPSWLVNIKGTNVLGQKRDLTSGGAAAGQEYVQTLEIGHQYGLEIAPKAFGLGIDVLTGLTGNVYLTETGQASAVWEGENDANAETTPATSKPVNLSPKRLGAFADISKTLLVQVAVAEQRLREQLGKAMNRKLDETVFQGTGVAPIPYGITTTAGVITSVLASGTPTRQMYLDAWAAIAAQNAPDMIKIVTTPAILAHQMGAYLDAGSGRFLTEDGKTVGWDTIWSNNIPADTIIVGDFAQFVVGQWGGIDLVINPYTRAKENLLEVVINSHWDMGCYRPKSFVVINDATL